jgi:amidohydrolase
MTLEKLTQYRRDLHQIPELGFDLPLTYAYIKEKLESFGYKPKTYAKTGLVAVKEGKIKEAISFRSDMDALPVFEQSDATFKSKFDGRMHACGHDGHMAMLLGFAEYVSKLESLNQTIVFIFQPAEEGPGGAKVMIDEGALKDHHVSKIFGLHVFPGLMEGEIGIKEGPMLAQNGEFDYVIHGVSSHGAQPHLGIDAILAASALVMQFNQIVSRYIDPLEPAVVTTGTIQGGEARNIIANKTTISGTIRAFSQEVYDTIKRKLSDIVDGVSKSYGVTITGGVTDYYPPVINDSALYHEVEKALKDELVVHIKPYMFAEDFAFYQQVVPGVFSFIGCGNEKRGWTHPLHSCYFNFDEKILLNGLNYYIKVAKQLHIF